MEQQRTVDLVVLYILAASLLGSYGLEFHLDTTHDVCGKLQCNVEASLPNHEILSVFELAVFDTTQNSSRLLMASISVLEPQVYVNDAIKETISATGNISAYHADLQIGLRKESFCHSGSFICKLTYVNPSGHIDVAESTEVKAGNDGNAGDVGTGVSSDMMDAVNQLINRTDNIESALATVDKKVDGIAQQLSYITSLLTKLVGDVHEDDLTEYDCYNGINGSNVAARTLITVVGDKEALCDTVTDGGGWVVFLRRADGIEDFYRGWSDYKAGFGDVSGGGDYWLGNEAIHQLTTMSKVELRVDMEKDGTKYYAQYSTFSIGNETTAYTLNVDAYSGDAGDSLHYYHNTMKFSTFDNGNDSGSGDYCAKQWHAAWWYNNCHFSHLTGVWGANNISGINWVNYVGNNLTFAEMKIRLIR